MIKIVAAIMVTINILVLVGCGDSANLDNKVLATTKNEFSFEIEDITITMHAEADNVISKLGGYKDYFESESCAFPGLDKVYTFNGFEVSTYPKDNKDYISGVSFTDDTVATKEGVALFQTLENVIEAYGDNYQEKNGVYTYTRDNSELSFMVKNNEVIQIEYTAIQK